MVHGHNFKKCPSNYYCPKGTKTDSSGNPIKNNDYDRFVEKNANKCHPNSSSVENSDESKDCIVKAGYYLSDLNDDGEFNPVEDINACSPGTYQDQTGQISCKNSGKGHYVTGSAQTSRSICVFPYYQDEEQASSCKNTLAGSDWEDIYSPPSICDAGHYCTNGNETPCAKGSFSPSTGASSCTPAFPGHYVASTGATTDTPCAEGSFSSNSGASSCTAAREGRYVASTGATTDTACDPGTYQPSTGKSSCKTAQKGHYVENSASTSQTACSPGTYQPSAGKSSCLNADRGNFVNISEVLLKKNVVLELIKIKKDKALVNLVEVASIKQTPGLLKVVVILLQERIIQVLVQLLKNVSLDITAQVIVIVIHVKQGIFQKLEKVPVQLLEQDIMSHHGIRLKSSLVTQELINQVPARALV